MFFQKKSEDPWDQKPMIVGMEEPAECPAGERNATEEKRSPMLCPWCGGEMTWGELRTSRPVWWVTEKRTMRERLLGCDPQKSLRVDHEGIFEPHKTAWHCWNCRKLVIDTKKMVHPNEMETRFDVKIQEREEKEKNNGSAIF